ncbi:MAG: ATP-binding cassette domain-containing protein [Pseudomonadota bacterium]
MDTVSDTSRQKPPEAPSGAAPRHSFLEQVRFLMLFWVSSDQKRKARLQMAGILALTVAEIALTAGVGFGFQATLNAMVAGLGRTSLLSGAATLAAIGAASLAGNRRDYMTNVLGQDWRGWLTRQFSEAWLDGKAYLRLQHNKRDTQNPDQRIAETIPNVTTQTLTLGLGLFRSAAALTVFSVMLWSISPLMVGAAVACAAGAHVATHWTGGSMRKIWKEWLDAGAKFRHTLVRVLDNAKPIALAGLEPVEKETMNEKFIAHDAKSRDLYKLNQRTGLVASFNANTSSVVPIALFAPKFFAGTATLGSFEFARQAYSQFYIALNWLPQGYTQISGWAVNVNQLMDFQKDLEENRADITGQASPPRNSPASVTFRQVEGQDKVVLRNLVLHGAGGKPLVDFGSVTLAPGDRMLLSGPAGCGKSAGVAAMRNSWLLGGSGDILLPPEVRFVPQEEYFPDRTLRGLVCAPDPVSRYTREQVAQALADANLGEFADAMDDPAKRGEYWKNALSGGQKNKLAFAGAFLHAAETKVLIVDEISAALDAKSEAELYPRLLERMRHGVVISIAHHASVAPMHNVYATVAHGKVSYTNTSLAILAALPEEPLVARRLKAASMKSVVCHTNPHNF